MSLLLSTYGLLALLFFLVIESIATVDFRRRNRTSGLITFKIPHLRVVVCSVFFPIVIAVAIISAVAESIMDRRSSK